VTAVLRARVRERFRLEKFRIPAFLRLLEPSLRNRMASGAMWSIVGAALASALTMLSNIACARMLGSTGFGQFAIVIATTNLFTNLFTGGLSMTATRYVAGYRDTDPDSAGKVIGLSTATALIVGLTIMLAICFTAPWISRDVLKASGLSGALMLGAVAMFSAAVNGSQTGALSGFEAFDRIALGNLIRGTAILILMTAGAAVWGLTGALMGYAAAGAVVALYYQIVVRRECSKRAISISYRFERQDLAILWRFTLPVLLSTSMFTPAAWWANVLLARRSGYAEAGIFNAISNWQNFILFFSSAIASIGLPILANLRAEQNAASYKKCLKTNFLFVLMPALAVAVPVAVCSPLILRLYGPSFAHGSGALMLIALAAILNAANTPVGDVLWSLDATASATVLAFVNGVTLVLASYALSGKGAAGLAGAYVVMGLVQTAINAPVVTWLVRQRFALSVPDEEVSVA
jgi:O-antigen/teichoic acid export membrane protein